MDITMDIKSKHYKIDTYIKETIKAKYDLEDKVAEAISLAMDMKEQDMSGYATKHDLQYSLKQLELSLTKKMGYMYFSSICITLGVIGRWLGKW